MTREQIKAILDRVLTWPHERQKLAANVLLSIEMDRDEGVYVPSNDEWAAIREGMAQARRGETISMHDLERRRSRGIRAVRSSRPKRGER